MKIALGCDHAGFRYKERIKQWLQKNGHTVIDFGTNSEAQVDYPQFIRPAALAVAQGKCERAIVLGGSGNGEAMVANRIPGVRCALCWSAEIAKLSRQHNDANVLAIGERTIPPEVAIDIVQTWLKTPFERGRHERRIQLIDHPEAGDGG
jgi:ribose 5-phosphate isomerase B